MKNITYIILGVIAIFYFLRKPKSYSGLFQEAYVEVKAKTPKGVKYLPYQAVKKEIEKIQGVRKEKVYSEKAKGETPTYARAD